MNGSVGLAVTKKKSRPVWLTSISQPTPQKEQTERCGTVRNGPGLSRVAWKVIAPVGQTSMQLPQAMQVVSRSGLSSAGLTTVS